MSLSKTERGNTFKSTVTFKSGSIYTDPSGNRALIEVYRPDGTLYISDSGQRDGIGMYSYYISTQNDADLGIWRTTWKGVFYNGGMFGYMPKVERSAFQVTFVD